MQDVSGVTVVSAPLAHTDRRALSEAWYRALHFAAPASRARLAPLPQSARAATGRLHAWPARPDGRLPNGAASQSVRALRAPSAASAGCERRVTVTSFARRLARAVVWGASRPQPSACTIRTAGGRIVVLVRGDGAQTRIVAVCTPPLRERVERALAHARFALAASARSEVA